MLKKISPFIIGAICAGVLTYTSLKASEDVLDDDIPSNYPLEIKALDPHNFKWIYSIALITSYFDDGNLKEGFALLLKNGFYLTSSELTYENGEYPIKIVAKMQDDSANPLICIAKLEVKGMDSQKGLALLQTSSFTDDYCHNRPESYYHKRIYTKYGKDIFALESKQNFQEGIYFPVVENMDTFGVEKTLALKKLYYHNSSNQKNIFYGYSIPIDSYETTMYGKPYFDKNGNFLGILTLSANYSLPILINKTMAQTFIYQLQKNNVFTFSSPLSNTPNSIASNIFEH